MSIPDRTPTASNQLAERISRYPSESKFLMYRNLSFGAAGVCVLMLSVLFPHGAEELPLQISLYASAAGIPLWLASGTFYEAYIAIGPKSYPHFRTKFAQALFALLFLIGGLSLLASIGGIVYFLSVDAAYLLGTSSVVAFILMLIFYGQLAGWLFQDPGKQPPPGL